MLKQIELLSDILHSVIYLTVFVLWILKLLPNFCYNTKSLWGAIFCLEFYKLSESIKFSKNIGHYKAACLGNDKKWYYFDDNHFEVDKNMLRVYEDENPTILWKIKII